MVVVGGVCVGAVRIWTIRDESRLSLCERLENRSLDSCAIGEKIATEQDPSGSRPSSSLEERSGRSTTGCGWHWMNQSTRERATKIQMPERVRFGLSTGIHTASRE